MLTAKIDVTKIKKEFLYVGEKGKYLDLIFFENRDGPDRYGSTHFIVQGVSKAEREKGTKGPIIGNARMTVDKPKAKPKAEETPPALEEEDSEVPF